MRAVCLAVIATVAATSCAASLHGRPVAATRTEASSTSGASRAELEALLRRINRRRVAIGCRALVWDDRLAGVAQRHSQDMTRRGYFSHTNPDGDDPFDRLRRAGIAYRNAAENLAEGQRSAEETYRSWMGSPGHRRIMEDCVYTRAGLGLVRYRWTLVLTRPAR